MELETSNKPTDGQAEIRLPTAPQSEPFIQHRRFQDGFWVHAKAALTGAGDLSRKPMSESRPAGQTKGSQPPQGESLRKWRLFSQATWTLRARRGNLGEQWDRVPLVSTRDAKSAPIVSDCSSWPSDRTRPTPKRGWAAAAHGAQSSSCDRPGIAGRGCGRRPATRTRKAPGPWPAS